MLFVYLLILVPISLGLAYFEAPPLWVFSTAALAIVPLAEWLRRATDQLAARVSSPIGGLLNITFGNMAPGTLLHIYAWIGSPDLSSMFSSGRMHEACQTPGT